MCRGRPHGHLHRRPRAAGVRGLQVGDGPWTVITPTADGDYTFAADGPTYGIAVVCVDGTAAAIDVVQASVDEATSVSFDCNHYRESPTSFTGSIAGKPADQAVSLHVADYSQYTTRDAYGTAKLIPIGTWDIFAVRRQNQTNAVLADRIIRKTAVKLPEGAATGLNFDFAAEGVDLETHEVTVAGAPASEVETRTHLRNRPGGTPVELGPYPDAGFRTLPASALRDDDIHAITVTATAADRASYRAVRQWMLAGADITANLPALPEAPQIDAETAAPYIRMRGTVPAGLDADRYQLVYRQPMRSAMTVTWTASLTRGYVAAAGSTYALPDFTPVAGFVPSWGLEPGIEVAWELVTASSDKGVASLLDAQRSAAKLDGQREQITERKGVFP